jgi:hypothetical protein
MYRSKNVIFKSRNVIVRRTKVSDFFTAGRQLHTSDLNFKSFNALRCCADYENHLSERKLRFVELKLLLAIFEKKVKRDDYQIKPPNFGCIGLILSDI